MRTFLLIVVSAWLFSACEKKPHEAPNSFASQGNSLHDTGAVPSPQSALEIPVTNPKVPSHILVRTGFTVDYNDMWRIPNWVAYELTASETHGHYRREGDFSPDPEVGGASAENSDYKTSLYSRGHMAPAGDMKWNAEAMHESFLLTNICPQNYNLNSGVWEKLESSLRDQAQRYGSVYIVCGPVVSKGYKTIGRNNVCVPQRFFKVVCWKDHDEQWHCKGYIFPNSKAYGSYRDYSTSVDRVEELTGHDFFSLLPDEVESRIEASDE